MTIFRGAGFDHGIVRETVAFGGHAGTIAIEVAVAVGVMEDRDGIVPGGQSFIHKSHRLVGDFDAFALDGFFVAVGEALAAVEDFDAEGAFLILDAIDIDNQVAFELSRGGVGDRDRAEASQQDSNGQFTARVEAHSEYLQRGGTGVRGWGVGGLRGETLLSILRFLDGWI